MKMKAFAAFSMLVAALVTAGCVATADGHMKAGVPLLKDRFVSRYDRPLPQLIEATRVVLKRDGVLTLDNIVNHTFEAKVNQRSIYIKCTEIDRRVSEIVIEARTKMGGTDLDLTRELDKQIAIQLTITH